MQHGVVAAEIDVQHAARVHVEKPLALGREAEHVAAAPHQGCASEQVFQQCLEGEAVEVERGHGGAHRELVLARHVLEEPGVR
ncbi:MAG: hypothetical protein H0X13_17305 [Ramlibacter sp.]|nr:hypothetical protein [Ramlibacter sp.]